MAQQLQTLSLIAYIAAAALLTVAVVLWFALKIPSVIGDLSGRTARRSIAKMRAANEKTGAKPYRQSKVNAARGKLTETMHGAGKSVPKKAPPAARTAPEQTAPPKPEVTTALLTNNGETAFLADSGETALLANGGETALLYRQEARPSSKKIVLLEEVLMVHTDEEIE